MLTSNQVGKEGELAAKNFLEKEGYRILETNWHCGSLEVDIIAQKDDLLAFCEVKSRTSAYFGEPESFVTKQKQRNLIKAASIYQEKKKWQGEIRFDIISVLFSNDKVAINHIEDAFGCLW